jgi:hypothetical protein
LKAQAIFCCDGSDVTICEDFLSRSQQVSISSRYHCQTTL